MEQPELRGLLEWQRSVPLGKLVYGPFDGLRAADDQNGMALPAAGQWPDWRRYFGGNKSQGAPLSICVWPQNEGDTKRISLGKDIVMGIKEHSGTGRSGILGHS